MIKKLQIWIIAILSILAVGLAGLGLGLFLTKDDNSNGQATVTPQDPSGPSTPEEEDPPLPPGITYDEANITAYKEQAAKLIGFDPNYQVGSDNFTNVMNSLTDNIIEASGKAYADSAIPEEDFVAMTANLQKFVENHPEINFNDIFDLEKFNSLNFTSKLKYAVEVVSRIAQLLKPANTETGEEAGALRQLVDIFTNANMDYATMGRIFYHSIINMITVVEDNRVQLNNALNELFTGYQTNNESVRALLAAVLGGSLVSDFITPVKFQMLAYGEQKYIDEFKQMLESWDEYLEVADQNNLMLITLAEILNELTEIDMQDEAAVTALKTKINTTFTNAKDKLFSHYKTYTNIYGEEETNLVYVSNGMLTTIMSIENKIVPIYGIVYGVLENQKYNGNPLYGPQAILSLPPTEILMSMSDIIDAVTSLINNFSDGILNVYALMAEDRFGSAMVDVLGGSINDVAKNRTIDLSTPASLVDTLKANEHVPFSMLPDRRSKHVKEGYTLFNDPDKDGIFDNYGYGNAFIYGYNRSHPEALLQPVTADNFEDIKNLDLDKPEDLNRFNLIRLGVLYYFQNETLGFWGRAYYVSYDSYYDNGQEVRAYTVSSWNIPMEEYFERYKHIKLWEGPEDVDADSGLLIFNLLSAFLATKDTKIQMNLEEYFTFDRTGFNVDRIAEMVSKVMSGFVSNSLNHKEDYIGFTATSRMDEYSRILLRGLWHADDLWDLIGYVGMGNIDDKPMQSNVLYTDPQTGKKYLILGFITDQNIAYVSEWDEANNVYRNIEYKEITGNTYDNYTVQSVDGVDLHASEVHVDDYNRVIVDKVIPTVQITTKSQDGYEQTTNAIKIVDKNMNPLSNMSAHNKLINYLLDSGLVDEYADILWDKNGFSQETPTRDAMRAYTRERYRNLLVESNEQLDNSMIRTTYTELVPNLIAEIDMSRKHFTDSMYSYLNNGYAFAPRLIENVYRMDSSYRTGEGYLGSQRWLQENAWWYFRGFSYLFVGSYLMMFIQEYNDTVTMQQMISSIQNMLNKNSSYTQYDYLQCYILQYLMGCDMLFDNVDYDDWELDVVSLVDNKQVAGFDVVKSIEGVAQNVSQILGKVTAFNDTQLPLFDDNGDLITYDGFYDTFMPELMVSNSYGGSYLGTTSGLTFNVYSESLIKELNSQIADEYSQYEFVDLSVSEANAEFSKFINELRSKYSNGELSANYTYISDSWLSSIVSQYGNNQYYWTSSNFTFTFTNLQEQVAKSYIDYELNNHYYRYRNMSTKQIYQSFFGVKGITNASELSNRTIIEWLEKYFIQICYIRPSNYHNSDEYYEYPLTLQNEIFAWASEIVGSYMFEFDNTSLYDVYAKQLLGLDKETNNYELEQFSNLDEIIAYLIMETDLLQRNAYATIYVLGGQYLSQYTPAAIEFVFDTVDVVNTYGDVIFGNGGNGALWWQILGTDAWFLSPEFVIDQILDKLGSIFGNMNRGMGLLDAVRSFIYTWRYY